MNYKFIIFLFLILLSFPSLPNDHDFSVKKIQFDLTKRLDGSESFWRDIEKTTVRLVGQMMINPKPKRGITKNITIQSVHNESWIAFKLTWSDKNNSIGEKLGEFSDGVALQFPSGSQDNPPAFFMGEKGKPVHLFLWKTIFQQDELYGRKDIKEIYPNSTADTYPMEFASYGKLKEPTQEQRDAYSHAKAAGNPQAFPKDAVDELLAEGYSTTTNAPVKESKGFGQWSNDSWSVVIVRPLNSTYSKIELSKDNYLCIAVWQGSAKEIGSRKSITPNWLSFNLEK